MIRKGEQPSPKADLDPKIAEILGKIKAHPIVRKKIDDFYRNVTTADFQSPVTPEFEELFVRLSSEIIRLLLSADKVPKPDTSLKDFKQVFVDEIDDIIEEDVKNNASLINRIGGVIYSLAKREEANRFPGRASQTEHYFPLFYVRLVEQLSQLIACTIHDINTDVIMLNQEESFKQMVESASRRGGVVSEGMIVDANQDPNKAAENIMDKLQKREKGKKEMN